MLVPRTHAMGGALSSLSHDLVVAAGFLGGPERASLRVLVLGESASTGTFSELQTKRDVNGPKRPLPGPDLGRYASDRYTEGG